MSEPVPGYGPGLSDDVVTESHDSVPEPARSYPIAVDWWAECFPQWKGQR